MAPHILRRISIAIFLLLAIFILTTFRHYGISNDEEVQHVYGRLLVDFYQSGFVDRTAFEYKNLYLYGGFFDLIAATLERLLGMNPDSIAVWDMRHLISALFGFAGIVGSYKLAKLLAGERAGLIAIMLLVVTGSWSGAMFTHTKDVPFGCTMIWALYYTALIVQTAPRISLANSIKLGLAVGCALGLRVGGAFAVIYLLLSLAIVSLLLELSWQEKGKFLLKSAWGLFPAGITALILMGIFWPWSVMAPDHMIEAAKAFSHFSFNMLTIMNGQIYGIGEVPRYYLLSYLLVKLPEITLIGMLALLYVAHQQGRNLLPMIKHPNDTNKAWLVTLIALLFPATFIMIDDPALYDGVRHFTFLIPVISILSACGLSLVIARLSAGKRKFIAIPVLLLIAYTACTLARLHPYEYIYYNHLAGPLPLAEKKWESDYWSSSLREAAGVLTRYVDKEQKNPDAPPYSVAICAEDIQGWAYLDDRFEISRNWTKADFFISSTNMNCDKVLLGKEIGKIERLGFTLAVIKDRRELQGKDRIPLPAPK